MFLKAPAPILLGSSLDFCFAMRFKIFDERRSIFVLKTAFLLSPAPQFFQSFFQERASFVPPTLQFELSPSALCFVGR